MYQVKYIGDPVLREISQNIEIFDNKFQKFIEEMTEIMYREDGIGLAAPQIGVTQNVVIIDISELEENESLHIFVNPVILNSSGESVVEEGCLSIPGVREEVTRPDMVTLNYQDETGANFQHEFDGWLARVLQHEVDHLKGVLFVDHLSPLKRQVLINKQAIPEKY